MSASQPDPTHQSASSSDQKAQTLLGFFSDRKAFLIKAGASLGIILVSGAYLGERYTLGADPQANRCLADYRTFVVDHHQHDISRDHLVAFHAQGLAPIFEDGTLIAKYVRGVPGDHVEVTEDHEVRINGEVIEAGLPYASTIGMAEEAFVGSMTIPEGEFWVMGDTDYSFDSRYWGTISYDQVSGKAHGLL